MNHELLRVPPDAVAGIADALRQTSQQYLAAHRPYRDQLDGAARALSGWGLGRGLEVLEAAWDRDVTALAARLDDLAERLDRAAAAYRRGDQVSASLFRTVQ